MITDKQRQRDYEYEADYQSKSRYTTEQWTNILNSGQLDEKNISLLKQIYSSFNHAATLLQLSFESGRTHFIAVKFCWSASWRGKQHEPGS